MFQFSIRLRGMELNEMSPGTASPLTETSSINNISIFAKYSSLYNKIIVELRDIMLTQCADRSQYDQGADSANSVDKYICQQ